MTIVFIMFAAVMVATALACVALPILRAGRNMSAVRQRRALDDALAAGAIDQDEYADKLTGIGTGDVTTQRSRSAFAALLGVVLLLPIAAIGLYLLLGEPRAIDHVTVTAAPAGEHGPSLEQAIAGLIEKLAQTPDDLQGWLLLGRAYKTTQRFAEAREALKRAIDLAPENPDAMIEYAEAIALTSESRRIEGDARNLIEKAVAVDPTHQRGLWLLGVAEYQDGDYSAAITRWEQLKALLPADSGVANSVQTQIEEAQTKAGNATTTEMAPPATSVTTDMPRLLVEIALDPKLAEHVTPDDTLFVFARAANGPPMPLAIQRLNAAALPAKIVLTDDMGMMPNFKLSQFSRIVVGARVSKSGNAIAESGDVQTLSPPIDVHQREPIVLTLDEVIP